MRNFFQLTKVQLSEIFNFRSSFSKKNITKTTSFLVVTVLMLIFFLFLSLIYNFSFASLLMLEDRMDLLFPLFFTVATVMTLMTTIFKVKGVVFGSKDFETLQSLPIKSSTIVASKLFVLYVYELIFTLIIMLPTNFAYLIFVPEFGLKIIPSILMLFFVPVVPIVIASLFGFLVSLASEKIRFKNIIQIFLYMIFFALIFSFSFISSNTGAVTNVFANITNFMNKYYPLASVYQKGCVELDILYLLIFIAVNLVFAAIFIFVVGKFYKKINLLVLSQRAHRKYVATYLKSEGQLKTLFFKELKKYVATPIYLMNTVVGGVMMIVAGVFALVYSSTLTQFINEFDLKIVAELVVAYSGVYMLGITTTTSVSISLEGNTFWIIKSLPIDYKKYYWSKIILNVLVLGTCGLIANILLGIAIKASLLSWVMLILFPIVFTLLTGVLGLLINLVFPKIKWLTEAAAVKNSAAVILTMLLDFVVMIVLGAIVVVGYFVNPYLFGYLGLIFCMIVTFVLIKILYAKGEKLISRIDV